MRTVHRSLEGEREGGGGWGEREIEREEGREGEER